MSRFIEQCLEPITDIDISQAHALAIKNSHELFDWQVAKEGYGEVENMFDKEAVSWRLKYSS
jgi:hypothetical protein